MCKLELLQKKADALTTDDRNYLRFLSKEDNYEIRKRVVNNINCSLELLAEIATNEKNTYVLAELSRQEKITEEIGFLILENKNKNEFVKSELAKNIKTTENILNILINDRDEYVRLKSITNDNSSLNLLLERLKIEGVDFLKEVLKDEIKLKLKKIRGGEKW